MVQGVLKAVIHGEILATYTALTGRPPLPPRWAFGLWTTSYPQGHQDGVVEHARQHRERDLPLDAERQRLVPGLVNRHPDHKVKATVALPGFRSLKPERAWLIAGRDPLAANTLDHPDQVRAETSPLPATRGDRRNYDLPACSVAVLALSA